jgi:hypothetical protein
MDTSFNGTRVNGKALPKGVAQPLVAGDVIECGCSRAVGESGGVSVLSFCNSLHLLLSYLLCSKASQAESAEN